MEVLSRFDHTPIQGTDPHMGMQPHVYALVFGTASGLSLPFGAWLGVQLSPVSDKICALMMAFGAGALLFAVTVELYGHLLHECAKGRVGMPEIYTTIFGALCGAAFYLTINQWLEEYLMSDEEKDGEAKEVKDVEGDVDGPRGRMSISSGEAAPLMAALRHANEVAEMEAAEKAEQKEEESVAPKAKRSAKDLWKKATKVVAIAKVNLMNKGDLSKLRGREKALRMMHDPAEEQHAKSVAFALFLGLLVDGVPEGVLMGFLAAEGHLTPVLIISLFVANFPEAFSSASLLIQARMSTWKIVTMWTSLCLLVGGLAGSSCYLLLLNFPNFGKPGHGGHLPMPALIGIALTEGVTGGAMIACISSVMLPEAFERAGKGGLFFTQSGFWCVAGFLLSVMLKALFG